MRLGNARALARLISWIENASPALPMIMKELTPDTGRAHVIGLTGAPGVGKSTTAASLVRALRVRGRAVGVLAVDPSSPFSGGALLGDRVRMRKHALDRDVYIRSMATRVISAGLRSPPPALRAFDAAGFDTVIVETVGVGQSDIEVAETADTTVVLLAPGMGDGIQAAKAGILEIGDIFVVNKSDRDGAQALVRELRTMIALAQRAPQDCAAPIVSTVAYEHRGIEDLLEAVDKFRAAQVETGRADARRVARGPARGREHRPGKAAGGVSVEWRGRAGRSCRTSEPW